MFKNNNCNNFLFGRNGAQQLPVRHKQKFNSTHCQNTMNVLNDYKLKNSINKTIVILICDFHQIIGEMRYIRAFKNLAECVKYSPKQIYNFGLSIILIQSYIIN